MPNCSRSVHKQIGRKEKLRQATVWLADNYTSKNSLYYINLYEKTGQIWDYVYTGEGDEKKSLRKKKVFSFSWDRRSNLCLELTRDRDDTFSVLSVLCIVIWHSKKMKCTKNVCSCPTNILAGATVYIIVPGQSISVDAKYWTRRFMALETVNTYYDVKA